MYFNINQRLLIKGYIIKYILFIYYIRNIRTSNVGLLRVSMCKPLNL